MAALTEKTAPLGGQATLETRTITNQSGAGVHEGIIQVPGRANGATFFLNLESAGGTTPLLDFAVFAVNPVTKDNGDMSQVAAITQLTAAGQAHLVVPESTLPRPWIAYRVTLDGTTADEDYTYQLYVYWHEEE